MKTIIEMAREAGLIVDANQSGFDSVERFDALVRADERQRLLAGVEMPEPLHPANAMGNGYTADQLRETVAAAVAHEREACAKVVGDFAKKWWSIHCDTNKHMETTRKAHDDFCALQAAIRARGSMPPTQGRNEL